MKLLKPQLVPNWKSIWRFWSMRLVAAGTAITSILLVSSDAALFVWNQLPADLKEKLPPEQVAFLGVAITALSFVARVLKQPNLPTAPKEDDHDDNHSA